MENKIVTLIFCGEISGITTKEKNIFDSSNYESVLEQIANYFKDTSLDGKPIGKTKGFTIVGFPNTLDQFNQLSSTNFNGNRYVEPVFTILLDKDFKYISSKRSESSIGKLDNKMKIFIIQ